MPCDPNNDGRIVLVSCPTCRAEVLTPPRYERLLDQTIEEAVRCVPPCAAKAEWEQRRAAYMDLMERQRAQAVQAAAKQSQFTSAGTAHVLAGDDLRLDLGLDAGSSFRAPEYDDRFWVVAITFVVVALVCAMRANK